MKRSSFAVLVFLAALSSLPAPAWARKQAALEPQDARSTTVPAVGTIEVAFSPNEGAEELVVKVIDSAKARVLVMAYSFTSAPVTAALIRAKKRGADVRVVADAKSNLSQDTSGKANAALSALATAGVEVRTIDVFQIAHDKVVVSDSNVELGSFNFTQAAARSNSENAMVVWGNAALAQVYVGHFSRNYGLSKPYVPRF